MRPGFLGAEVAEAAEDAGIVNLETSGLSAIHLG